MKIVIEDHDLVESDLHFIQGPLQRLMGENLAASIDDKGRVIFVSEDSQ